MTRHVGRGVIWTLCGLLAIAGAAVAAQGVLTQLGTTDADAKALVLDSIGEAGYAGSSIVESARRGYAKLPATARPQATTALYAWTKTYVNSAAFKTAYAARREEQKPTYEPPKNTPDQEMQAKLDKDAADMQTSLQQMKGIIPPADLAKMDAEIKKQIAQMRTKPYMDAIRNEIVEKRARNKSDYDMMMTQWNTNLPADSNARIGAILRDFLASTADVDFAAKTKKVMGEGGEVIMFVNDAYNKKPWQWKTAFDYGPDVLAAARAAASAWVKELPAK